LQKLAKDVNECDKPARLHIVQLDLQDEESVRRAAQKAEETLSKGIDYFINNAGINLQPQGIAFDDL